MSAKTGVVYKCGLVIALVAVLPVSARAQQTRAQLISEAYSEFESARRVDLLTSAVSPEKGPTDSLWAVGVQLLAQTFLEEGNDVMATVWLRWANRLDPAFQVDTLQFLPELAAAQLGAADFVARAEPTAEAAVTTSWRWPAQPPEQPLGRIEVAPPTIPIEVQVGGIGALEPGGVALAPGSYEIVAAADGYESARVTREVLPGVTTVLDFALIPILSDELAAAAATRLVRISYREQGELACRSGFFAGTDRSVLTTRAVLGEVENVELASTESRVAAREIRVAADDADRGVAVLIVPTAWADSMRVAEEIRDDQYVWAVHYRDCESAEVTRTQIVTWEDRPEGDLRLAATLPPAAEGGPIIDHSGAVVGVAIGADLALPIPQARLVLERAQRNQAAGRLLALGEAPPEEAPEVEDGGRFPFHWAALGVAAVGVGVALLVAGGGDGDGGEQPTTGTIVITFPN